MSNGCSGLVVIFGPQNLCIRKTGEEEEAVFHRGKSVLFMYQGFLFAHLEEDYLCKVNVYLYLFIIHSEIPFVSCGDCQATIKTSQSLTLKSCSNKVSKN